VHRDDAGAGQPDADRGTPRLRSHEQDRATNPGTSTSAQAFGSSPLSLASCAPGRYRPAAITAPTPAPMAIQPASLRSQRTATAASAAALVVHAAPATIATAAFMPTTGSPNAAPMVAASRWKPSG